MDSQELLMPRTFTIVIHSDDPEDTRMLEVPGSEPFDKFLICLQDASKKIAKQILPIEAKEKGLTTADGYWWFSLINREGVPQGGKMIIRSERCYHRMKNSLLARGSRWKAALVRNVGGGPLGFSYTRS